MESLQATYKDDDDEEPPPEGQQQPPPPPPPEEQPPPPPLEEEEEQQQQPSNPRDPSLPPPSPPAMEIDTEPPQNPSESPSESDRNPKTEEDEDDDEPDREDDELDDYEADNGNGNGPSPNNRKRKSLSSLTLQVPKEEAPDEENGISLTENTEDAKANSKSKSKKKKKKKTGNNVWVTRSTRKGKKKAKPTLQNTPAEDKVLITPVPRFFDKTDDSPEMSICLSKVYKAEKVELSEDRMSAGSTKGYRMVRATRGVCEGAWYYEIKVVALGETGHTRLGWSTEKGDLQAPVGYDGNSFGYRDVDGSKVHKALREKYGEEGYKEGDVIGFYISLPEGGSFAPKPPQLVWYKGQRYLCAADPKEDPPKIVPGSEISFFKNGVCQGVAFKDLYGGRYYPAASMYTLPNQPNCEVKFNFGPDFDAFPEDFGGRPVPRPMTEVPYHGYDHRVENGVSDEKKQ